jgi:hypothetical protein
MGLPKAGAATILDRSAMRQAQEAQMQISSNGTGRTRRPGLLTSPQGERRCR